MTDHLWSSLGLRTETGSDDADLTEHPDLSTSENITHIHHHFKHTHTSTIIINTHTLTHIHDHYEHTHTHKVATALNLNESSKDFHFHQKELILNQPETDCDYKLVFCLQQL